MLYSDPFYRITYLIKEEIRKYKWLEGEKGRKLSWEQARQEWTDAHREAYEKVPARHANNSRNSSSRGAACRGTVRFRGWAGIETSVAETYPIGVST